MKPEHRFKVTAKAQRPAKMDGTCFYCRQKIGDYHKDNCVLIKKRVRASVTFTYEVSVPSVTNKEKFEFHRNDSSFCADNTLEDLEAYSGEIGCLCGSSKHTYIEDTSKPFLDED
jgi:hypothetical protein